MFSTQSSLITLSAAAFALLWGGMLLNGTIDAMNMAKATGIFLNGQHLRLSYSGFAALDDFCATLVAFFDGISREPGPWHQMLMFCASLQTAGLWAMIEGSRKGDKHWLLRYPAVYVLIWNALGAATLIPIYCLFQLQYPPKTDPRLSHTRAKALIPAAVLGLAVPYALVMFPPNGTTRSGHQLWIALYQFSPLITQAIISIVEGALPAMEKKKNDDGTAAGYMSIVQGLYVLSGICCAVAHLSTMSMALLSTNPSISLHRIYLPTPSKVDKSGDSRITEGAHLFMQFDFIVVSLSCMIYVATIMSQMGSGSPVEMRNVGDQREVYWRYLIALLAIIALGPGATMSIILYIREEWLWEEFSGTVKTDRRSNLLRKSPK